VTDEDDVEALVERTRADLGGVDVLVNNAGVIEPDPVAEADRADLRKQIEGNLLGAMNVTHAALPDLLESGGGHVVTVSSMNARPRRWRQRVHGVEVRRRRVLPVAHDP
jgi:NAD(P)-dependent dehydrogenase (short-subunit alcohol dehydrogenase family)